MPLKQRQHFLATLSDETGLGIMESPVSKDGSSFNYVERAIAFGSKIFISDARSDWSTVMVASRANPETTIAAWALISKFTFGVL